MSEENPENQTSTADASSKTLLPQFKTFNEQIIIDVMTKLNAVSFNSAPFELQGDAHEINPSLSQGFLTIDTSNDSLTTGKVTGAVVSYPRRDTNNETGKQLIYYPATYRDQNKDNITVHAGKSFNSLFEAADQANNYAKAIAISIRSHINGAYSKSVVRSMLNNANQENEPYKFIGSAHEIDASLPQTCPLTESAQSPVVIGLVVSCQRPDDVNDDNSHTFYHPATFGAFDGVIVHSGTLCRTPQFAAECATELALEKAINDYAQLQVDLATEDSERPSM